MESLDFECSGKILENQSAGDARTDQPRSSQSHSPQSSRQAFPDRISGDLPSATDDSGEEGAPVKEELQPQPQADADAKEINALHKEVRASIKMTLPKAIRIGELLVARREKCQHGEWLPWLEANVEFSQQSASVYMRIFEHRGKLPVSGNLTETLKLLNDTEPTKRKRTGLKSKTDRSKSGGESQNGASEDKEGSSQNGSTLSVDPTIIQGLMKSGFTKAQAIDFATKSAQQTQETSGGEGMAAPETEPKPPTESAPPVPPPSTPPKEWWNSASAEEREREKRRIETTQSFIEWLEQQPDKLFAAQVVQLYLFCMGPEKTFGAKKQVEPEPAPAHSEQNASSVTTTESVTSTESVSAPKMQSDDDEEWDDEVEFAPEGDPEEKPAPEEPTPEDNDEFYNSVRGSTRGLEFAPI